MSTATEDRTDREKSQNRAEWPDGREETEELIRKRAKELDGKNGLTPEQSAILANRAVHDGSDYLGTLDGALRLVEVLEKMADLSHMAPEEREVPIQHPAAHLIYRLADELEEARRRVQENVCRREYALARLEPASDLCGYAETHGEMVDISDVGEGESRE